VGLSFYSMKIKIIYDRHHPELQDCPLGCVRMNGNGIIVINPDLFYAMTDFEQRFWLLHEEGHIALDTDSETKADEYAFNQLAGTEFRSLKQMVAALNNLLSDYNPETHVRKKTLMKLALEWDKRN
jgi:hypothetical protein